MSPIVPFEQLAGYRQHALGFRHRSERSFQRAIPAATRCTGSDLPGRGNDAGQGTDFKAVAQGFVSVTPLSIDLTRHAALPEVAHWLDAL
jgi:5'-nucleotidase